MKKIFTNISNFLNKEIWLTNIDPLSPRKKLSFISLRVFFIILKGFKKDKCSIYAAALTNITIMSLVPTLAFLFAIAHGFGFYAKLKEKVESNLNTLGPKLQEFLLNIINNIEKMDMSTLGVIGLAVMFWTVISLMGKIEGTFNVIWGIKQDRDFVTKCKEYVFILMIVPTSILLTTTITTALSNTKVTNFLVEKFGSFAHVYEIIIFLISPLSITLAFTYLYKFLPNTKVKFFAAFMAGIFTTILWQILQWTYLTFQVGVSKFNGVYGTFASIPLFMVWLYSSWLVILFGAELSFALQNHRTFEDEAKAEDYSVKSHLTLAIYLMRDLSIKFVAGKKWLAPEVLKELQIPSRFGNLVIDQLIKGNVIKCVNQIDGEYLPAKDLTNLNLNDVYIAILGENDPILRRIHRNEYLELITMNNEKLSAYIKNLSEITFYQLIQKKPNEIQNL